MRRCAVAGKLTHPTALDRIRSAWTAGDRTDALRLAARLPRLGEQSDRIRKAWSAQSNPRFYRELGEDPTVLIKDGHTAMAERWNLPA